MVMPMKSTRYTSSSGLFAHAGTEAPRVSFGGAAGTGWSAAAGFCRRAEGVASARLGVSAAVPAEGGGTDRAALSCGAEASASPFASGGGLAAGATASGAPIAVLSGGEASASSSASSVATAGGSHSGTAAGAALSPASSSRPGGGEVAPCPPQWQPDGTSRSGRRRSADIPLPTRMFTIRYRATRSIRRPPASPGERRPGRSRAFPRRFLRVSVSRSDQDRRGPEANPHRNVAHFITDHEAGARIRHPEPPEDRLGQPRPRLPASARAPIRFHRPFRVVRAILDRVEHDPLRPERGNEPPVDGFHLRPGEFPPRQAGLVGNHREEEPFPGEEAQRLRGSGQDADGRRIAQVSDLLDQRAVPVEEDDPPHCRPR